MLSTEGPTRGDVEQYEVMDVDQTEGQGQDGPGPQRCEFALIWLVLSLSLRIIIISAVVQESLHFISDR